MKKNLFLLSVLSISLVFNACGDDAAEGLRRQILKASQDGSIDDKEWGELTAAAKSTAHNDCAKLKSFVESATKRKGTPKMPECSGTSTNTTNNSTEVKDFSLFIENSNSMMGYFNGATEFKDALMDIPARAQDKGGNFKFYFITKEPKEISTDYKSFIKKLDTESAKYRDQNLSLLDELIGKACETVLKEKRIAVLASDFIYDVGNKKPQDALPKVQYAITDQIQKFKKAGDNAVLVLKMNSLYSGKYYSFNGKSTTLNEKRPYYIWMFGPTKQLIKMFRDLNLETLKGFDEYAFFYAASGSSDTYFSVLPQTDRKGTFGRERGSEGALHSINKAKADDRDKVLQFAVAVDLSEIPTADDYLTTVKNYELSSDKNDAFELVSIKPIKEAKVNNNDEKYKGKATHLLTVKTTKLSADAQSLNIRLLKQMPDWIEKSASDDDTNVKAQLKKTFGLQYVMDGLINGYILSGTKPAYIEFKLSVNK